MSRALHAFTSYAVKEDMGDYKIHYENDKDYDIADGNWSYIYTIVQYAGYLIGTELNIPIYDYFEDGYRVYKEGMTLTDIDLFIKGLNAVINNINELTANENPLIDGSDWYLYDADKTFDEQKENIIYYANMLLEWSKQGLHFVEEKE